VEVLEHVAADERVERREAAELLLARRHSPQTVANSEREPPRSRCSHR
jgi:hypothetical protein